MPVEIQAYQQIVDDLASTAGIKAPKVNFYDGRNAFYRPFTHRIYLSKRLVSELSCEGLRTLLAHEVGHAKRRGAMLSNIGRLGFIPLGSWLGCCAFGLICYQVLGRWPALAMMTLGLVVTLILMRKIAPALEAAQLVEELAADRFAESAVGRQGAIEHALREIAGIEDSGYLGSEAESRISQLRNEIN
jgi:Zn-dependent protease with chaperone function